jgi:CMP-N,N'-diacetyllegionaminic acid synthase
MCPAQRKHRQPTHRFRNGSQERRIVEATIIAVIPARAGSRGVTRKNTRVVAGKPLIAHTIEAAVGSRYVERILVSTDDPQIAEIARRFGAETPFTRPAHLADDEALLIDVIRHAARWLDRHHSRPPTHLVTLPPVNPLITSADIEGAVQVALRSGASAVVSVNQPADHPYQIQRMTKAGVLERFLRVDLDALQRQDYPAAYTINGAISVNRCESILHERTLLPEGTQGYVIPASRSMAVRTLWDLHLADMILRQRSLQRAA